ncbi:MAG: hypothetical protein ASARMPRED_003852 [Alectoria sarmentosa]|nr:MAG: hypothetical protein ASARMPRED_003852 [Alectoria sarmentosa]
MIANTGHPNIEPVATPLLIPLFVEAQTVKAILTMRAVAAVEAQIITPTRQPLNLGRLAFVRPQPDFVIVKLGVLRDFDDPGNGGVLDLIDAVSDGMTGGPRLQRIVEQGHICFGRRTVYPRPGVGSIEVFMANKLD